MIVSSNGKEKYHTIISNGNMEIHADTTEEKGGSGKYFRPHDLLCASYAACLNMTVRMILEDKDISYESIKVNVDIDRSQSEKTIFLYDIEILGDIDDKTKQLVMRAARNCPVRKTLSKEIIFLENE